MITSFPNPWHLDESHEGELDEDDPHNNDNSYNLKKIIQHELGNNKARGLIKSTEFLVHLILKTSLDFFRREGPLRVKFQECFQSSIHEVVRQLAPN